MSTAIVRVSVVLGACAALINLLVWHQPIMAMVNGHLWAVKVLYAVWFVLGWGVATGALTGLAISSMWLRSPGRFSAAVAFIVSLFLTMTVCLVLHRCLTDVKFMQDAMSGFRPFYERLCRVQQPTRFSVVGALTPNFIAVALSVIYAFRRKAAAATKATSFWKDRVKAA
jgi:hypothetical protein